MSDKTCTADGCDRNTIAMGLCNKHYLAARARRNGVPLRERKPSAWRTNSKGYVYRKVPDEVGLGWHHEFMHRRVMSQHLGRELLREEEVHHKDGDRSNNDISNLELWSTRQPKGQRVEDKVEFALEILRLYRPERLR